MKRSLSVWSLFGLTFAATLGTILHFLYDWTGLPFLTPVAAVNESTWEHMKILFFPMLLFAFIQRPFFKKEYDNFWQVKCFGILVGVLLIPVLFYTYNGAFGTSPDWVNILIFFVAAGAGYWIEGHLFKRNALVKIPAFIPLILLSVSALAFVLFTYFPPNLPLFFDPLAN